MSKDSSSANLTCHLNNIAIDTTVFFGMPKRLPLTTKPTKYYRKTFFPTQIKLRLMEWNPEGPYAISV
jgi:hypothetical protein